MIFVSRVSGTTTLSMPIEITDTNARLDEWKSTNEKKERTEERNREQDEHDPHTRREPIDGFACVGHSRFLPSSYRQRGRHSRIRNVIRRHCGCDEEWSKDKLPLCLNLGESNRFPGSIPVSFGGRVKQETWGWLEMRRDWTKYNRPATTWGVGDVRWWLWGYCRLMVLDQSSRCSYASRQENLTVTSCAKLEDRTSERPID